MQRFFRKNLFIFMLCMLFPCGSVFAVEGDSVIFYPTDVTKAGDLAYLKQSVRLMLASRLASVAGIQPQFENKLAAGAVLKYRIKSHIVSSAKGVSVSASVFPPSNDAPSSFKVTVVKDTQVMKALDDLVDDIAETLFDVKGKTVKTTSVSGDIAATDFHTPHPDRQIKENSGFGLSIAQDEFVAEMAVEVAATERYKSTVLSFRTRGMTAGDIDGDTFDEILIATNTKIHIYQLHDKRIRSVTSIALPALLKVHAINVADLNGNGVMEIYLSATRNDEPVSFILEWHAENGVSWIQKNIPLYLRPMKGMGATEIIAAQRGGIDGGVIPGIFRLSLDELNTSKGELLPVPDSVNLFEFVFADLEGDGVSEIVSLNKKEELEVYSSNLDLLYTSPSGFGGREYSEGLNRPVRLVVVDFNSDGNDDILLVDNELYSPQMMKKSKYYENGQVRGLMWDKDLFLEMWRTNIFQKSIVDFQFLPFAEAGKEKTGLAGRLFVVEPAKGNSLEGLLLGSGATRLSVFGLEFIPKGK